MGLAYHNLHGLFITNFIFIASLLLCTIPIRVQVVTICDRLHLYKCFNIVFRKLYHIFQMAYRLYWVARQRYQLHMPEHRLKKTTQRPHQQLTQTLPPLDECIPALKTRPILIHYMEPSPLLTPPTYQRILVPQQDQVAEEPKIEISPEPPTSIEDQHSINDTPVCQAQPLLGTTYTENLQLQDRNQPEDIADILGTTVFKGYINTPLQTLDGILVQQPKWFLPLAEEAKQLAEEIHIEKLNEQWAGIPHEKLLNQYFWDQLNSLQILEQLAILELAKQHLWADIIDILECLGKANNIPFNQLYYIMGNCMDQYYSKVIETFVAIIKRQFTGRQLLLVNIAHLLKFLEEYSDRQAQIWKIFHKYHNIPDNLEDLHLHFDDFKTSLETDFRHLKEVTSHNIQNIQTSLNVQQTYSSTLCCHVNSIYSKLSELQRHIRHHCMYSHQGNTVQIEAPEFDPDIDGDSPVSMDERHKIAPVQGILATIPKVLEPEDDNSIAPGTKTDQQTYQETDWPDASSVQIPRVSSLTAQPEEQGHNRRQVQPSADNFEIPELEENSEKEQFADFDAFMAYHNTHQASEHIWQEYCTIPVPVIVLCLSTIFVCNINSSELHFQSVALRSQYSDHAPEAVTLH